MQPTERANAEAPLLFDDRVPPDGAAAREIGFQIPETYNASAVLFDNLSAGNGDRPAVHCGAETLSYAALCARACRIGAGLLSLGLARGDRVLLFLNDSPDYAAAIFGAIRAGLVPVLINTLSPKDLVRFYLEDSGARAAVVAKEHVELFDAETVGGTSLAALVVIDGPAPGGLPVEAVAGPDWLGQFAGTLEAAPTHRNEMAFWMYSSGSTGRPKGIVHLQHDIAYTAASYGRRVLGVRPDDICFSVPKIFFAYGFGNSLTFPFSVGAATALLPGRPTPAAVFDLVRNLRPTLFFALPTVYTALVKDKAVEEADFSSVRRCISAAEVLSADVFNAWKDRFGHEIVEGLGSTEVLHIYLSNTPDRKKLGSAGKRVPGYELRLTDGAGKPVGPGKEGVLWVRGDSNAPCYWNRPDKTAETMRDGWIWTGDRFTVDEDGFHFFRGRADDLIKVSGQWVYTMEVELCLNEHPAVLECAVLGEEMADGRMTLVAYVAPNAGVAADDVLTAELQRYVKESLLPYKYPRVVRYLDLLPKTGTDKIDRQALRKLGAGA